MLAAASVLTSADASIVIVSPMSCEVTLVLTVDGAGEIEHRAEAFDGSRIDLVDLSGARRVRAPRRDGRTLALVVRPERPSYTLRYRADQPPARRDRCPLWLPAAPSSGRPGSVHLDVRLPEGAAPGGTMPALAWAGTHGAAALGHLPAFLRVPYAAAGEAPPWNVARVMDAAAIVALVGASVFWARRRKG
jgi:hypothetical protein